MLLWEISLAAFAYSSVGLATPGAVENDEEQEEQEEQEEEEPDT